jgi:hypothetical protein
MAEVARRHGVTGTCLSRDSGGRRGTRWPPVPIQFVPVGIAREAPGSAGSVGNILEGARILVGADVDTAALTRVINALARLGGP